MLRNAATRLPSRPIQSVIDKYPDAAAAIRRSAWMWLCAGSFALAEYRRQNTPHQVLAVTPEGDESARRSSRQPCALDLQTG